MAEEEKQRVNYRVWPEIIPILYLTAGLFDIISLVPLANDAVLFVGQFVMAAIFAGLRVNVLDERNWIWFVATWIGELIWPISVLPMFVFETWRFIFISKRQDEIKASALARTGAAAIAKSQYVRGRMQQDRRQEREADKKKELERPGSSRENSMANARGSRDAFKAPREERSASDRARLSNPDAKKNTWNNISDFADRPRSPVDGIVPSGSKNTPPPPANNNAADAPQELDEAA